MKKEAQLHRKHQRWFLGLLLGVILLAGFLLLPWQTRSPAERKVESWLANPTPALVESNGIPQFVGPERFADFGPETIPYLIAVLTNRSSRTEQYKSRAAMQLSPKVYWKLPAWLRHWLTPFRSIENDRVSAERALACLPDRSAVVAALIPTLQDPRNVVRYRAASVLCSRTARGDTNWLAALAESLRRETDPAIQTQLAWALGRIDANETAAITLLRANTNAADRYVRALALRGLSEIETGERRPE